MGSCFSDIEEAKQAIYRDGYTYEDDFGSFDTQPIPSAPSISTLDDLEEEEEEDKQLSRNNSHAQLQQEKDEEERQLALAIMVSLEPELQQGNVSPLLFWQSEPTSASPKASSKSKVPFTREAHHHARGSSSTSSSGRMECEYCYDALIGATCDPCGHVACVKCWVKIQGLDNKCPKCRVVIKKIIKLYM